jgi:hypothetical protein
MLMSIGIDLIWIMAFNSGSTQVERVQAFLDYFPAFMNLNMINGLVAMFCLAAIMLSGLSLKMIGTGWKVLNLVTLTGSTFSLLMLLFSTL